MPPRRNRDRLPGPAVFPGDPDDTAGFPRLLALFLEALAVKGQSPGTLAGHRARLELFCRWALEHGLTRPREITRPIVERYQRHLFYYRKKSGRPLAFPTQQQRLISLRSCFRWLARNNFILYNPAAELETPRLPRSLPKHVLTAAEVEELLAVPDVAGPFGLRDRALLETFYSTGLRRAELAHLKLPDLECERRVVWVRAGKGGKDRVVPIGERALAWLERYLSEVRPTIATAPDDGVLFLTYLGQPFALDALTRLVPELVERAGLGKTGSCHLLRHSMATLMLENGADIRYVQEMLGHAQLSTTQLYTQVSIRKLQEIHAATHPAARCETEEPETTGKPAAATSAGPPPTAPDPAQLLAAALANEAADELGGQPETDANPPAGAP